MVLNEEKRAILVEVLALRQDVAANAGASVPSTPPTNQDVPSPTPSAPIAVVPLATVRASPTPAPLRRARGWWRSCLMMKRTLWRALSSKDVRRR